MTTKTVRYLTFLLIILAAFNFAGCSRLSAPSDAEAIKAIQESEGLKGLTLQSPIVILEKGDRNPDGSWPVKVKVTFTYEIKDKQMSPPVEKKLGFKLFKSKDNAGHAVWKAIFG